MFTVEKHEKTKKKKSPLFLPTEIQKQKCI